MSGHQAYRPHRHARRNSATPSVSSDDGAPRSPPNSGLSPLKEVAHAHPSVMTNVHREWQKMRYSRRSAGSSMDNGVSAPMPERTSPLGTPAAASTAAPRPSFMSWAAQSPMTLPARPQTFVSPLAEWALGGKAAAPRNE